MKAVNVVDISFLASYLKKYYEANNMEGSFLDAELNQILREVRNTFPDIILLQSSYYGITGIDLIRKIREEAKMYCRHSVFILVDIFPEEAVAVLAEDAADIVRIRFDINDFSDRLNDVVRRLVSEAKRQQWADRIDQKQKSILIVDDDLLIHEFARSALKDENYNLYHAFDGDEGYEIYLKKMPDLVLTDLEMPHSNGLELCRKIRENKEVHHADLIVMSSLDSEQAIENAYNNGADDYLVKPVTEQKLFTVIDEFFMARERNQNYRIVVVDDSRMVSEIVQHAFSLKGFQVVTCNDSLKAIDVMKEFKPDVAILDIEMPGLTGYELCGLIRQEEVLKHTVIMIMSARDRQSDIKRFKKYGIHRYFVKPFDVDKMVLLVEQLLLEKYHTYQKEYDYMMFSINSLVKALEARDGYTKGHTDRVTEISVRLGRWMGMDKKSLLMLEIAASLHDVGKIGVRDGVLLKPDRLDNEEYGIIKTHPSVAVEILKPIKALDGALTMILHHHERWDGRGYPEGLKGEEIPLGARIIAVADTYDAITTDRPYRKQDSQGHALDIISENAGSQLCPTCVSAFLEMMKN